VAIIGVVATFYQKGKSMILLLALLFLPFLLLVVFAIGVHFLWPFLLIGLIVGIAIRVAGSKGRG
jgi:hypothetical protein